MDRENQQGTTNEADIAWLAGVIECDGSVMLSCYVRKNKAVPKIGTEIKIYNTDAGIIRKAVSIIESLGIQYHLKERAQKPLAMEGGKKYGGRDPMLIVTVKRLYQAYLLGKLLRPYMYGQKGARLDLMVQYLARRVEKFEKKGGLLKGKRASFDKGDLSLVLDFYKKFVKRPGHNRKLVDGLLNEYEQSPDDAIIR